MRSELDSAGDLFKGQTRTRAVGFPMLVGTHPRPFQPPRPSSGGSIGAAVLAVGRDVANIWKEVRPVRVRGCADGADSASPHGRA